MLTSRYAVFGRGIVSEAFDGDVVVLDLDSGRYFSFTDAGCALWEGLVEGASPQTLIEHTDVATADEVRAFLQILLDNKLLKPVDEPATPDVQPQTLHKLAQANENPAVSIFDDLADLFLADPIHDVEDEAGWPVVNKL